MRESVGRGIDISRSRRSRIQRRLLTWYNRARRDLPWRRTDDPYRIVVAEFMLQQTQVEAVIPYYGRFLSCFPSIRSLAAARQSDVLKVWEGLGYYARARNLHRAAQAMVEEHDGVVPDAYDALASLPGFGPYTTGAVLSIAYGLDHAVVDGNVIRVLSRLFGIAEDVTQTRVKKGLWELARRLLPEGEARSFNQAMMELGATLCIPKSPACPACPLRLECVAFRSGDPASLPTKPPRKARPHHTMGAGIVWRDETVLIGRRPEEGLLGGLWELPTARRRGGDSLQACCLRGIREGTGVDASVRRRFRTVKHAYTHFAVTVHAFECAYQGGRARALGCTEVRWEPLDGLDEYAFSRINRKLVDSLLAERDRRPGSPAEFRLSGS